MTGARLESMIAASTGARVRLCALLVACVACSDAAAVAPRDDPVLAACLERGLPRQDMTQSLTLKVFDATGSVTESRAKLYWQRAEGDLSRFLIRVNDPPMRAGIAVLALERSDGEPEIYIYLPELRRTRRVTGRTFAGSMLGTDFSYEDYLEFQGLRSDADVRRLDDGVDDGRPVFVVETLPNMARSAYSRILSHIDQQQCLPLSTEFIGRDGKVSKRLVIEQDGIQQLGDRYVPQRVVMHDLRQDSRTELVIDKVELDSGLNENQFKANALERAR